MKMNKQMKYVFALTFLALAACGGGGGGGAPIASTAPVVEAPKPICTVEFDGDSILWGEDVNFTRLASPPAVTLKRIRPAYTIDDRSQRGQTAQDASKAFNTQARTSRIVVIQYGVNDMNHGFPLEASLTSMVSHAKGEGRIVVMTGLSKTDNPALEQYRAVAKKVATEQGVTYADWPSVDGKTFDGIHPDQAFSTALTEKLAAALDVVAPTCSLP